MRLILNLFKTGSSHHSKFLFGQKCISNLVTKNQTCAYQYDAAGCEKYQATSHPVDRPHVTENTANSTMLTGTLTHCFLLDPKRSGYESPNRRATSKTTRNQTPGSPIWENIAYDAASAKLSWV